MTDGDRSADIERAHGAGTAGALMLWAGLAAAVLAAGALWVSEGAAIFVQNAFAALAACL